MIQAFQSIVLAILLAVSTAHASDAMPPLKGFDVQLDAPEVLGLKVKQARSILVKFYGISSIDRGVCGIAYLYKNGFQERSHRICPPLESDGERYEVVFQPEVSLEDGESIQWSAYFLMNGKMSETAHAISKIQKLPLDSD